MQNEQWRLIKECFQHALDHPPEQRADFIAEQCPDAEMRAEVLRLLDAHDRSTSFLNSPITAPSDGAPEGDPLLGKRIGEFVLIRQIGTGGMGQVYEAAQQQPRRLAAVKVLRPGLTSPDMLRRFEVEVEILGKLQHPSIAHAYAGGTFDFGDGERPWFAMELVNGLPLDEHLKSHSTSLGEKLRLFALICDAVQHAHQRGVIHRDLKPANIIIEEGTLLPKILDFGIARAADPDMRMAVHTGQDSAVGTLNFMSPEQLAGNAYEVDARSDVYSLGVIGYFMLAGRLPHDRRKSDVADLTCTVEFEEPPRLGAIDSSLRGDLECIFAMALKEEPTHRYQTAAELAADVRRHLRDELVLARPPTTFYQVQKFARRNRIFVGGVCATLAALLAGMVLYATEARQSRMEAQRSRYEAEKAVAINNFITNDFMMNILAAASNAANSDQQSGASETRLPVADMVDRAAASVGTMFRDQPLSQAAVRNEIGTIYYNLGAFERAAEQFALAQQLWEVDLSGDHPDTLKALNNLGQCMARLGRSGEAESLYRRALEGRTQVLGADDPFTLASMNNLANLLRWTGRLDESEALMRTAFEGQRRVLGDSHKHTLISMYNLGTLLADKGKVDEGRRFHQHAYETSRKTLGADHVTTLTAGRHYAETLRQSGSVNESESLIAKMLESLKLVVGPDHPDAIHARRTLARAYIEQGRTEDCIAQVRLAIASAQAMPGRSEKLVRELDEEFGDLMLPRNP